MREQLLGYLMAALEPQEIADVETRLQTDPELARTCELLRQSLYPLQCDREVFDPPPQLASRTCVWVAERATIRVVPETSGGPRRWSIHDMFVTAGTVAAAALLFFPAINFSRNQAQIAGCQNQLRQIGLAFMNYSERFPPYFPVIPENGPLATSGAFAPALLETGLVDAHTTFLCPADRRIQPASFRVPSRDEVQATQAANLGQVQATLGGSFGVTYGHLENGKYVPTKDLGSPHFALVSDLPDAQRADHQSSNHGGQGQNTLFEDCHVKFLKSCKCPIDTKGDDIFANDAGQLGPGLSVGDSVIGNGPYVPSTELLDATR